MKIIAFYLPQFHRTKENDEWWGEGFTEWVNMKKAKKLYDNHYQPRIPLNKNYYDLLDVSVMKKQTELAKKYGIYGFCVYHYWFEGRQLLQKPMENFLKADDIDFPFCFCWANETWTAAWATNSKHPKVLMEQTYGQQEAWKRHFEYLLPFFKDKRYIKNDNKPLFVIYRPEQIPCLNEMLDYLNELAMQHGFGGIEFASQQKEFHIKKFDDTRFKYKIEYQPDVAQYDIQSSVRRCIDSLKERIILLSQKYLKVSIIKIKSLIVVDYDKVWKAILSRVPKDDKMLPGAFVDWDNTPRYGKKGKVIQGAHPDKFYKYMKQQIIHARDDYKKDMLFLFAWNEWAEGGYMEPDEKYQYGYLEALKKALEETDEYVREDS